MATCRGAVAGRWAVAGDAWNQRFEPVEQWQFMGRSRLNVFYTGSVQGVGFRYTVKALAGGFEVTGTVRNLPDGRVELRAEGLKDELSAFQQAIRESELGHFIRREEVTWAEPTGGLRGFEIIS
jgi:acylphosphatase